MPARATVAVAVAVLPMAARCLVMPSWCGPAPGGRITVPTELCRSLAGGNRAGEISRAGEAIRGDRGRY
jgi:hypothetical protein